MSGEASGATPGTGIRRIAVVTAGLSVPSSSRMLADRLAEAARARLEESGAAPLVQTFELRGLARGLADRLVTGFPGGALGEALDAVAGADGVIAVTPVFAASYSGLFKSFFDVLEQDALAGVPVLAGATGGTARHSLALDFAVRPLFAYLRAPVAPTAVFAATDDWASAGDNGLAERIARAGAEFADLVAGHAPAPRAAEDPLVPFEQQLRALRPPR